ncbi:MAG: hypothetical protein AAF620_03605 [Bacteroidota bacterium]
MCKAILSILLFFSISFFGNSQDSRRDSLIHFSELVFNSSLEREYFQKILDSDKSALFEGFMMAKVRDKNFIELKKRSFEYQLNELQNIKKGKKNDKYLKKVYEELHLKFFRKYEEMVSFEKIFENGRYNCVTACALYGLAFDHLEISYSIKETPTHVYIVAFPDQDQIVIETTDPIEGFRNINESFKRNFITSLQQQKLIDSENTRTSLDKLFDEYYYAANEIDLIKLIGIHYYNVGFEFFQLKDYDNALTNFAKAYFIYDSEQITDMLFASLSLTLSEKNYDNPNDVKFLGMLNRFRNYEISDSDIKGEFGRMTQKLLIEKNDTVSYDSAYRIINELFSKKDSVIKNEVAYIYHYERARVLYNRAYYPTALAYAKTAYELKPESIDSETLLIACFSNTHINASSLFALSELNILLKACPSLTNNNRLGSMWLNLHLQNMFQSFLDKESKKGFDFKSSFEELVKKYPNFRFDPLIAGSAYAQLVAYYFRRGQISLARNALEEGFKYSPNNAELKAREYALNR